MFYKPRFLHHIYAKALGYFWLPCPLCGEHFGGHEWMESKTRMERRASIPTGPNTAIGVCRNCIDEADKITEEYFKKWRN